MPETSKDHTRSLVPYQKILEAWEAEYRETAPASRESVIDKIMEQISTAAAKGKAKIADNENLQKQITNFYTNHRSVIKEEDGAPIKVAKQWTARLVAGHYHHAEIMEAVKAHGPLAPQQQIGKWASALTEKWESLPEEDKAKYAVLAEQWREQGPPPEVKRREAEEKTGKYALAVLKQLERQLGVHAVLLVTYQDTDGEVKISDFESQGIAAKDRFGSHHSEEMEKLRKKWGRWAIKTFGDHTPQEKGDEGESDEETHADKQTPPEERFLQKDSDGLWVLGPLPDLGTVRNTDLSTAFHVYVTQQWRLKKGAKRVMWKGIREANEWYINKPFLLPSRTFDNPTRLSESDLRAYWKHWYNSFQSGKPFTFKRTGARDAGAHNSSDEPKEKDLPEDISEEGEKKTLGGRKPEEEEDEDKDSDRGEEVLTPDQCHSEGEKIRFLRSLVHANGDNGKEYQEIIDILAQMRVGDSLETVEYPAKCFSWNWSSIHADKPLHVNAHKIKALHEWFAANPHLEDSGGLTNRASLLQICLGLGILLDDACRVLFTEDGEDAPKMPDYLTTSRLGPTDYNRLVKYTSKLQEDLLDDIEASSRKKRKASTGEPAHTQNRAKKVVTHPRQNRASGVAEESEEDKGTSGGTNIRKSTRNKKEPARYKNSEATAVGKAKEREGQGSKQGVTGTSKKRGGRN